MVGHDLGGPHASEDHLPGVARSGASARLGGGLGSARPDALQLDRGGGKSVLLDLPPLAQLSPSLDWVLVRMLIGDKNMERFCQKMVNSAREFVSCFEI